MSHDNVQTILVVHPGTLGDVLLSLGALRELRRRYPRHHIWLLAGTPIGRLLLAAGDIQGHVPLEGPDLSRMMAGLPEVSRDLHDCLSRCQVAMCWMKERDHTLRTFFSAYGVERVLLSSPHDQGASGVHQAERYRATLAPMGEPQVVPGHFTPLCLPDSWIQAGWDHVRRHQAAPERPMVLLHPGSGSPHKCASPESFAGVLVGLEAMGATPILLGGPADQERVGQVVQACSTSPIVLQNLELEIVAGLLHVAKIFIGHDSGLTHLAAAVGVPTLAIFGPTSVDRWKPQGHEVVILSGHPCRCDTWSVVKACTEKYCLQISSYDILQICRVMLEKPGTGSEAPSHRGSTCSDS